MIVTECSRRPIVPSIQPQGRATGLRTWICVTSASMAPSLGRGGSRRRRPGAPLDAARRRRLHQCLTPSPHAGTAAWRAALRKLAGWPGLQVLSGDLELASRSLNAFWTIWSDWGALPEEYDFASRRLVATRTGLRYPLRPELIEATYFMHRATQDDSWLWAASRGYLKL